MMKYLLPLLFPFILFSQIDLGIEDSDSYTHTYVSLRVPEGHMMIAPEPGNTGFFIVASPLNGYALTDIWETSSGNVGFGLTKISLLAPDPLVELNGYILSYIAGYLPTINTPAQEILIEVYTKDQ